MKIYNELAVNEVDLPSLLSRQNLVYFWRNRGNILLKSKEYQLSVGSYTRAIKLQSRNHQLWLLKGIADFQSGNLIESFYSLTKAVIIKPYFYQKRTKKLIIRFSKPIIIVIQQVIASFEELIKLLKEL